MSRIIGMLSWGGFFLWLCLGGAEAQNYCIRPSPDGSLALKQASAFTLPPGDSGTTRVPELKCSRVQIYMFKNSSRGWPAAVFRSPGKVSRRSGWGGRSSRVQRLDPLINKYARLYGVDRNLIRAVMRQESGFNPQAVSPKGAMGLMQLMPETAALMGVTDPFDVEQNISGGVKYLRRCLNQFNDVRLALAAYNAGPENVIKYCGCPPFAETQNYVASVIRDYSGPLRGGRGEPALMFSLSSHNRSVPLIVPAAQWHTGRPASRVPARVSYSWSGKGKIIRVISRRPHKNKK